MHHELTIRYTKEIVVVAARQFICRWFGASGVIAFVAIWLISTGLALTGNWQWYVIALLTVAAVSTITVTAVFVLYRRRAVARFHRFDSPDVRFTFTDDGLSCESSIGTSMIRWSAVQKVWRFNELCLVFVGPSQYVTIPTAQVPQDILDEILDRIRNEGCLVA